MISYSNIVLVGPSHREAVYAVAGLSRIAYVSPPSERYPVVYDKQCDDAEGWEPLRDLGLELTNALDCGALGFRNATDEHLLCMLFSRGHYLGCRAWGGQANPPCPESLLPTAVFAELICDLLDEELDMRGIAGLLARVDAVLAEEEREGLVKYAEGVATPFTIHTVLAAELALGHCTAGIGFHTILTAETGEDASWRVDDFRRIDGK